MLTISVKNIKKRFINPPAHFVFPKKHLQNNTTDASPLILQIPSFKLSANTHVALKGNSGSGKTTFLNIISGILRPDEGSVQIIDTNITSLSEKNRDQFRAKHIGYVFQTFNLLQGYTALENVMLGMMFGNKTNTTRAEELLKKVDLHNRMHYLPKQLSVGQQQRVAIVRALANSPKLVLADEPTGSLDKSHTKEAITLIRNICQENGSALLLVTHDPYVLEHFDTIDNFHNINQITT